jgi:hypothetical protein
MSPGTLAPFLRLTVYLGVIVLSRNSSISIYYLKNCNSWLWSLLMETGKRGIGRPNVTWEESMKRDLKDWSIAKELALDRIIGESGS